MDFQGPTPADYENVLSLNRAFLRLLQNKKDAEGHLEGLSAELGRRLRHLNRKEIGWLAATPFLLFSFRERDDELWQRILGDGTNNDLFTVPVESSDETRRLVSAGLAYVWQLADRNPFAARLICGASTHWCEQITERTFFDVLSVAGHRRDLLVLRARHDTELWKKLLRFGLSEATEARTAAHISALQQVLTRQIFPVSWSAAACVSRDPALKVAEGPKT